MKTAMAPSLVGSDNDGRPSFLQPGNLLQSDLAEFRVRVANALVGSDDLHQDTVFSFLVHFRAHSNLVLHWTLSDTG
jgi:hypothetical protein